MGFGIPSLENVAQNVFRLVNGKADDVQAQYRSAAHSVDVAEGVGDGDGPIAERVVYYGWEEVHREHKGLVVPNAVDSRVVPRFGPNQQVRISGHRKMFQNLDQV